MKKLIFLFALVVTLFSCTENERAKIYGGKLDYRLKPNEVLINATWKAEARIVTSRRVLRSSFLKELRVV
jgi:hypothetical protein